MVPESPSGQGKRGGSSRKLLDHISFAHRKQSKREKPSKFIPIDVLPPPPPKGSINPSNSTTASDYVFNYMSLRSFLIQITTPCENVIKWMMVTTNFYNLCLKYKLKS